VDRKKNIADVGKVSIKQDSIRKKNVLTDIKMWKYRQRGMKKFKAGIKRGERGIMYKGIALNKSRKSETLQWTVDKKS
jgi:hypothetical protein